ncbi:hypothetical protein ABK040_007275 [Willaertia magna]
MLSEDQHDHLLKTSTTSAPVPVLEEDSIKQQGLKEDLKEDNNTQRYDRQMRAIGKEAMQQIHQTKVLIIGCNGLSIEIIKNLMLMGFKSITIFDNFKIVNYLDLNSQFYLNENDLGKLRLDCCFDKLIELNNCCKLEKLTVTKMDEILENDFILKNNFNIVITTDDLILSDFTIKLNNICHENNIKFISGFTKGLFATSFVDFGKDKFIVKDIDGEPIVQGVVTGIEIIENRIIIDTKDHTQPQPHGLANGNFVNFHSIEGMTELNNLDKPIEIKVIDLYKFELLGLDVKKLSKYTHGGYFRQVKEHVPFYFKSLQNSMKDIDEGLHDDVMSHFLIYNFAKMDYPLKLYYFQVLLNKFIKMENRFPENYNLQDFNKILNLLKEDYKGNERVQNILNDNLNLLKLLTMTLTGPLNPMCTLLGGLLAQEAQKACTGKFSPLNQWFNFEALECIPKKITEIINNIDLSTVDSNNVNIKELLLEKYQINVNYKNNRYDAQYGIFGEDFQNNNLMNKNIFLVGAGALGCEYLKNFAMIGLGCGPRGEVIVTDMDSIEISNLSRQFLFREEHVGHMKSECASKSVLKMNPSLNIKAMGDRVGRETENVFNDEFWTSKDLIVNALDNIEARLYVDSKCVYYHLPLLESGTLGTKANSESVIPYLTNNYGKHKDPPQKTFPECTIHRYPNVIQHTISWAKAFFTSTFFQSIEESKLFLKSPSEFLAEKGNNIITLESVSLYLSQRPKSFEDCLDWCRIKFEELYNHAIRNILLTYPEDFITKSGAKFWSGSKKCPRPLEFNIQDLTHLKFIFYGALLYSQLFNIKLPFILNDHLNFFNENKDYIIRIVEQTILPKYIPNPIARDDDDAKDQQQQSNNQQEEEEKEEENKQMEIELEQEKQEMEIYLTKLRQTVIQIAEKINEDKSLIENEFYLNEIEFEKDDDLHMEFITSASNLRARCYKIPEADLYETKGIAGNIIPAMITTTALITGLVGLELYKVLDINLEEIKNEIKTEKEKEKFLERFSQCFVNIGIPFITMSDLLPCKKDICNERFDIWDNLEIYKIKDNINTLKDLINYLQNIIGYTISTIAYEGNMIYTCFMENEKKEKRLNLQLDKLLNNLSEKVKYQFSLQVIAFDLKSTTNVEPIELPRVIYKVEKKKITTTTTTTTASNKMSSEERKKLLEKKKLELKQKKAQQQQSSSSDTNENNNE